MRAAAIACLLVAMVATGCATVPVAGPPLGRPEFGVQFHGTWDDYDDNERAMVLNALVDHGVTTVRLDVSWRMLEPDRPGQFDPAGLARVDNAIRMAAERGLRPLVMLWLAPQWANGSSDERVPPTSARGLAGLTSVTERLARTYVGVVDAWEIWNEPNDDDFMRGASPEQYAAVLRAGYDGLKAGDREATVVFAGPSYVDDAWVGEALAAGAAGHFDVMGVHPYMAVADEPPDLPDDGGIGRLNHLPSLIEVMAGYGAADTPIWFTEFGWRVAPDTPDTPPWRRGVTPAQQRDYLISTLDIVGEDYPTVERVYWYRARADSDDPLNTGYGLVLPDGGPTYTLAQVPTILADHQVPSSAGSSATVE